MGQSFVTGGSWDMWSAQSLLLASMEQTALYNSCNFMIGNNTTPGSALNQTATNTKIMTFLCPSDANAGGGATPTTSNDNSYNGSVGTTTLPTNQGSTGMFTYRICYGLRSCTDGSSNTVAFSEGLVGDNTTTPKAGYRGTSLVQAGDTGDQFLDATGQLAGINSGLNTCDSMFNSASNINGNRGHFWEVGAVGITLFNTIVPPNSTQHKWSACRSSGGGWPDQSTFANASSNHSGGVNVLFSDGSVKFVKDSINMATWWALGTRANGEVIDASSY
jgi:prepilin-type processing-associated H-X9-DG protein